MWRALKPRNPTSKVCVMCGVKGPSGKLATCQKCRRPSKHIYCMPLVQLQIPDSWHCVRCERNVQNPHDDQNRDTIKDGRGVIKGFRSGKHVMQSSLRIPPPKVAKNAKVKYISPEEIILAHLSACKGQRNLVVSRRPNDYAKITSPHVSRRPVSKMSKLPVSKQVCNAEVAGSLGKLNEGRETLTSYKGTKEKLEKTIGRPSPNGGKPDMSNYDAPPLDIGDVSKGKADEALQTPIVKKPNKRCSDLEVNYSIMNTRDVNSKCSISRSSSAKEKDEKLRNTGFLGLTCSGDNLRDMSRPNKLTINTAGLGACWKGIFEVSDGFCQTNTGIQAYYPCKMAAEAYEMSKIFPVNLKLKTVPRMDAWPKLFRSATPSREDIGLFFLPDECERPKEYACLMTWIDAHDFAMQTTIGDAELLVFSSTQLIADSQRIHGKTYLWGVFQRTKNRKRALRHLGKSCLPAGIKDKYRAQFANTLELQDEVDMTGGVKVGRIDTPFPNPNCPPGFERQIRRYAGHL